MSTTDRDLLIKAALTPTEHLQLPVGLADDIHREIIGTAQLRRGWTSRLVRHVPVLSAFETPVVRQLAYLLVLLVLAAAAVLVVGSRREPVLPALVASYHGGPGQTGLMPGPGPADPEVAWEVDLSGPMNNLSMPVVTDGIAYLVDTRGTAIALHAVTGGELWSLTDLGATSGAPVLVGQVLILATEEGTVMALDRATGDERWRTNVAESRSAPLTTDGERVLVGTDEGQVHAISALDGQRSWSIDAGGPVRRSPAIADGVAYVAADGGSITAVDLETGQERWRENIGEGEVSTPAVSNGIVALTRGPLDLSVPHELVTLDAASGVALRRWNLPTVERAFLGALVDGVAWTVGEDGLVRSVDVTAVDAALETRFDAGAPIGSLAAVVGDTIYIASTDGAIHALDRVTAFERWVAEVEGSPTMPVVVDGRVFVGTTLGKAVALADAPADSAE